MQGRLAVLSNPVCLLLLLLLSTFMLCTSAVESQLEDSIQCQSDCGRGNALRLGGLKEMRCRSKYVEHSLWPASKESTAPRPESIDSSWYINKEGSSKARLAFKISWTQKKTDLKSGKINGYLLEYYGIKVYINLTINEVNKTEKKEEESKMTYVRFDYLCAGASGWNIPSNKQIPIKVSSMPLYFINNKPQTRSTTINVPTCFEEERFANVKRLSTPACRKHWKKIRNHTTATQQTNTAIAIARTDSENVGIVQRQPADRSIYYVLVCVVGGLLVIAIFLKIAYNAHAVGRYPGHGKILMISPIQDNYDLVHTIATKLRNHYQLDITSNWENQADIGDGALDWYRERMEEMNIVLFAVSHKIFATRFGSRSPKKSAFSDTELALNVAQALKLRKPVTVVFLVIGNMDALRSFWLRQTSQHTVYDTSHTFGLFMQRMTGSKTARKMTLQTLLDMGQYETTAVEDEIAPLNKVEMSFACLAKKNIVSTLTGSTVSLYENVDSTEKIELIAGAVKYQKQGARPKNTSLL